MTHPPQYVDFGGCAITYPPYKTTNLDLAKVLINFLLLFPHPSEQHPQSDSPHALFNPKHS